eukprot:scaffold77430_cov66-Phaeocystis_antarctica.AAC.2
MLRRRARGPCGPRHPAEVTRLPLVRPWAVTAGDFGESMHVMAGVEVIVPIVASRLRRLRPRRGKVDRAPHHRLARTFP